MIALCGKSPADVSQTNTNLSGSKYVPNKPINGLYNRKILKRSVERTLDVTQLKGSAHAGIELC